MDCIAELATAQAPGAIAIFQLHGDVSEALGRVTGRNDWAVGTLRLVGVAGIDEALACRITPRVAQLMPHGGVRVVQRIAAHLRDCGVVIDGDPIDPIDRWPEAADLVEALMLEALSTATSPLAIDLLLDQPRRWRGWGTALFDHEDRRRWARLRHLLVPPRLVLVGAPNTGKSTLANRLLGREASIVLDEPGTTRDTVASRIELGGLVVDWYDAPGQRTTGDDLEASALALSRRIIADADAVVVAAESAGDWIDVERTPLLRIGMKADLGRRDDADLCASGLTGEGLEELVALLRDRLVRPDDIAHGGPWRFDKRLPGEAPSQVPIAL